jgi:hypothetical protein
VGALKVGHAAIRVSGFAALKAEPKAICEPAITPDCIRPSRLSVTSKRISRAANSFSRESLCANRSGAQQFHGLDYSPAFAADAKPQQRLSVMAQAIDWVDTMQQAASAEEISAEEKNEHIAATGMLYSRSPRLSPSPPPATLHILILCRATCLVDQARAFPDGWYRSHHLRRWMRLPEFHAEYLQARRDVVLQTNARM